MTIGGIIGINNSNPFNVKQGGANVWAGTVGIDAQGHVVFIDPIYSVRAAVRILSRYQLRDNAKSLVDIFRIYAPKSDGNDPEGYAQFIGEAINEPSARSLSLFHANGRVKDHDQMQLLLEAMLHMEIFHGYEIPAETIRSGIRLYERDFCKGDD